jgi:hypothetical protein
MTTYFQVLTALEHLLDKAGEKQWRDWLRQDITLWESKKDVTHHLSAYGGMGSFNDVWICVGNGYKVTKAQEPWVNNLFEMLKGLCFQLAHNPDKREAIQDINSNSYAPIFKGFVHSLDKSGIDKEASQFSQIMSKLHGWRCLKCGHSETKTYDIENYLARIFLPKYINNAKTEKELKSIVDSAFAIDFDGISQARSQLKQMILGSNIEIVDREGWMRPCKICGSDNTAVYRWELRNNIFYPSKDNVSLEK